MFNSLGSLQQLKIYCTLGYQLFVSRSLRFELLQSYHKEKNSLPSEHRPATAAGDLKNPFLQYWLEMAHGFSKSLVKMSAYYRNSIRIFLFSRSILPNCSKDKDFQDFSKWPDFSGFFSRNFLDFWRSVR